MVEKIVKLFLASRIIRVALTTFSTTWLTHTVYDMKGVSPYIGCCVSLGKGWSIIYNLKSVSTMLSKKR